MRTWRRIEADVARMFGTVPFGSPTGGDFNLLHGRASFWGDVKSKMHHQGYYTVGEKALDALRRGGFVKVLLFANSTRSLETELCGWLWLREFFTMAADCRAPRVVNQWRPHDPYYIALPERLRRPLALLEPLMDALERIGDYDPLRLNIEVTSNKGSS